MPVPTWAVPSVLAAASASNETSTGILNDIGLAELTISVLAAVIAVLQYRISRQQRAQNALVVQSTLLDNWRALEEDWRLAIGAVRGPDEYFSPVYGEMREDLRREANSEKEWESPRSDILVRVDSSTRRVLTFLGFLSSQVLAGGASPTFAWNLLGPDVIRQAGALRPAMEYEDDTNRPVVGDGGNLWFYPGIKDRVYALIDLLWAEAARTGELSEHEAIRTANYKTHQETANICRERTRSLARLHGNSLLAIRLDLLLVYSQFPVASTTRTPLEACYGTDSRLFETLDYRNSRWHRLLYWATGRTSDPSSHPDRR